MEPASRASARSLSGWTPTSFGQSVVKRSELERAALYAATRGGGPHLSHFAALKEAERFKRRRSACFRCFADGADAADADAAADAAVGADAADAADADAADAASDPAAGAKSDGRGACARIECLGEVAMSNLCHKL